MLSTLIVFINAEHTFINDTTPGQDRGKNFNVLSEDLLNVQRFKLVHSMARPLGGGWGSRPPDMEVSCEYIEQAVVDSRPGVVLQLRGLE